MVLSEAELEIFDRMSEAINSNKKETFSENFKSIDQDRLPAFLTHQNTDGNTLLHLIFLTKDVDMLRIVASLKNQNMKNHLEISNNQGFTPRKIINNLDKEQHKDFRHMYGRLFRSSYSQNFLLFQMKTYLEKQKENQAGGYNAEDVTKIQNTLSQGHCSGLTTLWSQFALKGREEEFQKILEKIVKWDGEDMTPETIRSFEEAISAIRFAQVDGMKDIELKEWKKAAIESPKEVEGSLNLRGLGQDQFDKKLDDKSIKDDGNIIFYTSHDAMLKPFIAKLCKENNGKIFMMSANGHVIGIQPLKDQVKIYDSNYKRTQKEVSKDGITKIIPINKDDDYKMVFDETKRQLLTNLKGPEAFDEINTSEKVKFQRLSNAKDIAGPRLPNSQDVINDYKSKIGDEIDEVINKGQSPQDINDYIRSKSNDLNNTSKWVIYDRLKKLKFNESDINVEYTNGLGQVVTPLHEAIKLNQARLVEIYLQNGADPTLQVNGVSPIELVTDEHDYRVKSSIQEYIDFNANIKGVINNNITAVNFKNCKSGEDLKYAKMLNSLEKNTSLDSISFGKPHSSEKLNKLLPILVDKPNLKSISLIADKKNVSTICDTLLEKKINLIKIELNGPSWPHMGDKEVDTILKSLENNYCITSISMQKSSIKDEGAKKILQFIKEKPSITEINLSGNSISKEIMNKITEQVSLNKNAKSKPIKGKFTADLAKKRAQQSANKDINKGRA